MTVFAAIIVITLMAIVSDIAGKRSASGAEPVPVTSPAGYAIDVALVRLLREPRRP